MAELPEITILAEQMQQELAGKRLQSVDVVQPKCLNLPPDEFASGLVGSTIERVYPRGKWVFAALSGERTLLLNVGMGGDVFHYRSGEPWQQDYQCRFHMDDESGFTCKFWWFGYLHLVPADATTPHKLTGGMAPSPFEPEFTRDYFHGLFKGRKNVKGILMDQRQVAGIGNVYIQDILFRAGLHPLMPANRLSAEQVDRLYDVTVENLRTSYTKGAAHYERDFHGRHGGFDLGDLLVGYKEGKPCPACGTTVVKLKAAGTASYICPTCQPLPADLTAAQ